MMAAGLATGPTMAHQRLKPKAGGIAAPPIAAGSRSGSAPRQAAARDRGADTRAELIEAALDVFGQLGFEGASTRVIAKAAGANLAAIVYHFGGKEALYLAVAEHVAQSIFANVGPTIASAASPRALESAAAARAALDRLIDTFIAVILGSADAERWARFIVREQLQPTAAFDVIYRFMSGAADTATRLIAVIQARPIDDEMKVRVFTILGQVMVFRVAHALVLRRMGWRTLGERQRSQIRRVVGENLTAILGRGGP
jgi:AcrR family transcriptional regulator